MKRGHQLLPGHISSQRLFACVRGIALQLCTETSKGMREGGLNYTTNVWRWVKA